MPRVPSAAIQSVRGGLTVGDEVLAFNVGHADPSQTAAILARDIDKLRVDIRSFKVPLKRSIQQVIAPSFQTNFDVGGRPPWEPWSEFTPEIKRRTGRPVRKLMIQSGKLRRVSGQLNLWDISRTEAFLSDLPSRVWYGRLQQLGYEGVATVNDEPVPTATGEELAEFALREDTVKFGAPDIPARPFLVFQDEDVDKIERVFVFWLSERMAQAGFKVPGF